MKKIIAFVVMVICMFTVCGAHAYADNKEMTRDDSMEAFKKVVGHALDDAMDESDLVFSPFKGEISYSVYGSPNASSDELHYHVKVTQVGLFTRNTYVYEGRFTGMPTYEELLTLFRDGATVITNGSK